MKITSLQEGTRTPLGQKTDVDKSSLHSHSGGATSLELELVEKLSHCILSQIKLYVVVPIFYVLAMLAFLDFLIFMSS